MEIILFVHVSESLQSLVHNIADEVLWKQFFSLFHKLVHVHVQKLKDEVECIPFQNDFVELDDVWM
jgi:hypothetical protein